MNRRALLNLASAALAATATPAAALCIADPADTPVMRLFREWEAADRAAHLSTGDECDRLLDARFQIELRLIEAPAHTAADVLMKIIAWTSYGDAGIDGLDTHGVWAEARALVGGAA